MQWRASSFILFVNVNFEGVEEVQSVCHVALGSHVQHVQTVVVLSILVCTMLQQAMNSIHIASKGS